MSGFDFDALRDPEAPLPGSVQRTRVHARADELRARTRRNRLAMSATSIVAVAAIVVGVVTIRRTSGPTIEVQGPTVTQASSTADRFVPPTSIDGETVTVPVTLPDGETLTMQYPRKLAIAQLGFRGSIDVRWPVSGGATACCGRVAVVSYSTTARAFGRTPPIATYRGADGEPVPLLHAPQINCNCPAPYVSEQDLAFQFGPWLVRVAANSLTDEQRATFARSLTGTVDTNGYLVLRAQAPLSIGNQFDGGFNPIDVGNFVRLTTHSTNRVGRLTCGAGQSDTSVHRRSLGNTRTRAYSWCVGEDLHVSVGGSSSFVDLANEQLQISPLTPPTAQTTTTSVPPAPPSGAVSASFVSPNQGWLLAKSGDVLGTTDGGASWHRMGNLGIRGTDEKIRFIGPSDGFAFGPDAGAPPVLITHDAGAHWIRLDTPFSQVSDLEISRGFVYVAGTPSSASAGGAFAGFRIWSTPVAHLVWSMDPLVIPPGAGPVPSQQLVFAGKNGWMVNQDRGVIGGGRVGQPGGRWRSWTPPCSNVGGGSAFLAAPDPTDLVASCSEHVWSGGPVTYGIYFSGDGGATFQRRSAAAAGLIASPNATTAIIANGQTLVRTTDRGTTWQVVARSTTDFGYGSDVGFTTSTQGFWIANFGAMFMTHDAGATWNQVTP